MYIYAGIQTNLRVRTFRAASDAQNLSFFQWQKQQPAGRAKTATFEVKLSRTAKTKIYVAKINIINDFILYIFYGANKKGAGRNNVIPAAREEKGNIKPISYNLGVQKYSYI